MKLNLEITMSKILAYLVLIIGSIYSFIFKDPTVLISTFGAASAIIAVKTFTASKERQKELEYNEGPDGPDI